MIKDEGKMNCPKCGATDCTAEETDSMISYPGMSYQAEKEARRIWMNEQLNCELRANKRESND